MIFKLILVMALGFACFFIHTLTKDLEEYKIEVMNNTIELHQLGNRQEKLLSNQRAIYRIVTDWKQEMKSKEPQRWSASGIYNK